MFLFSSRVVRGHAPSFYAPRRAGVRTEEKLRVSVALDRFVFVRRMSLFYSTTSLYALYERVVLDRAVCLSGMSLVYSTPSLYALYEPLVLDRAIRMRCMSRFSLAVPFACVPFACG